MGRDEKMSRERFDYSGKGGEARAEEGRDALKAMRETAAAMAKLAPPGAGPAAPPPITCNYCGGPVGADEARCPECGAKAGGKTIALQRERA